MLTRRQSFRKERCTCNRNFGFYQGLDVATEPAKNNQYLNCLWLSHTKGDVSTTSWNLNIHAHRDKLSNSKQDILLLIYPDQLRGYTPNETSHLEHLLWLSRHYIRNITKDSRNVAGFFYRYRMYFIPPTMISLYKSHIRPKHQV